MLAEKKRLSLSARRGSVLLMSLSVLLVLITLTGSFLFAAGIVTLSSGWERVDAKIFWLAEAGLNKAIWYLITPPARGGKGMDWTTTGTTERLGEGSYTMKVERQGDVRRITSTGAIATGGSTFTRNVVQEFVPGGGSGSGSGGGGGILVPVPNSWREL